MVTRSQILSIESEYSLLKVIGKGTYAEVYKAQSLSSKLMRAIKKVNKSKAPGIERLFSNEFELLKDIVPKKVCRTIPTLSKYTDYNRTQNSFI
jgi:serine/threonine protein kinase